MCILCLDLPDEFDIKHMEAQVKKLNAQERKEKASQIKAALKDSEYSPIEDVSWAIEHLRQAQYMLSRYM